MYTEIEKCRVCGNTNLVKVVDLGEMELTGVFPKIVDQKITKGPLQLLKCHDDKKQVCGLLQLAHSYDLNEMYGDGYGYRSGLNASMVTHLQSKVEKILSIQKLQDNDLVIDIGSNDGTTLGFYPKNLKTVGIDPTAVKFSEYYAPHIQVISDFFSSKLVTQKFPLQKAKVVTSFSMFYDLESPIQFANEIASILDPENGIWVFEQSYMPLMIEKMAYDTICHEHLEYYGLHQIEWIIEKAGLKIIDIEFNDVNGGSFSVVASHKTATHNKAESKIQSILKSEIEAGYFGLEVYRSFAAAIEVSRKELLDFVNEASLANKKIYGLGASTKGNVVLQFCNFDKSKMPYIAEVNPDKFGSFTPGTRIPIKDQRLALEDDPDYLFVLPWHFKNFFVNNTKFSGRTLVFPLPKLEVVQVP